MAIDEKYNNMIRDIKTFAESAAKWSPERIQRAKETVRVFDLTLSMPRPELKESEVNRGL